MAPKKAPPRKQGQKRSRSEKEVGESSSSGCRVPAGLKGEDRIRFQEFVRKKVFKSQSILDWDRLDEYGLVPAMRRLLRDEAWLRLFSMEERLYKETTLAFLASFKARNQIRHARMTNEVTFYAFGNYHTVSMRKFVGAMGLYTREELDHPDFRSLPVDLPTGVTSNDVWRSLSQDQSFEASRSKSSSLKLTSHRVFHYLQVRNLNTKMESPGTVGERDIPPLYSVTQPYKVNVGVLVAAAIRHQAGVSNNGIFIGGMITRILKNLKLWPKSGGPTDIGPKPKPLPKDPFSQWNVNKVNIPGFDAEAPGIERLPPDTAHFSAGNLARLERHIEELKRNQATMMKKQNGMIELLKNIANHLGTAIPACLCGSPPREPSAPREEGESSQGPALLLPPPAPLPPLDKQALARGVILSSSDEEMDEGEGAGADADSDSEFDSIEEGDEEGGEREEAQSGSD